MHAIEQFALEHLRQRPDAAARLLESLTEEECSHLLLAAPPAVSAAVVSHMLPDFAGRFARGLDTARLAPIVAHCAYRDAMPLLRALGEQQRNEVLAALEMPRASGLKLLLRYPENTVGARMLPDAVTLRGELSVGEARQRIRQFSGVVGNRVFLLDGDQRAVGAVSSAQLLAAPRAELLSAIGSATPATLAARAPLAEAAAAGDWRDHREMPVADRHQRFVGVLPFGQVYPLLSGVRSAAPIDDIGDSESLAGIFVAGGAGLWQVWMELLGSPDGAEQP